LLWNISYPHTGISRAAVEAAADAAGLGELMRRLPEGLDTIAGERGLTLSTGERQRVAIARAFLSDPEVIILDEPSAALDPNGERELLENLRWRFAGKTLIVITHKPHMALAADHIIRIENGQVAHAEVAA
jgi:ATP-binding cassette subfamily B protein